MMKLRIFILPTVLLLPVVANADDAAPVAPKESVEDGAVKQLAAARRAADEKVAPSFRADAASAETRRALAAAMTKNDVTQVQHDLEALAPALKKSRDAAAIRTSVNPREVDDASKSFVLPTMMLSRNVAVGTPLPLPTRTVVGGQCDGAMPTAWADVNAHLAAKIEESGGAHGGGKSFTDYCNFGAVATTGGKAPDGDKVRVHVKGTATLLAVSATGGAFAATGSGIQVRLSIKYPTQKPANIPAAAWAQLPHESVVSKRCQLAVVWSTPNANGAVDVKTSDGAVSGTCELEGIAKIPNRWVTVDLIAVTTVYTGLAGYGVGKAKLVPTSVAIE